MYSPRLFFQKVLTVHVCSTSEMPIFFLSLPEMDVVSPSNSCQSDELTVISSCLIIGIFLTTSKDNHMVIGYFDFCRAPISMFCPFFY